MKIVKMCNNPECSEYQKKDNFNLEDEFCSKCGSHLDHVCKGKKCHTILVDDKDKYCINCSADNEDRKDKHKENMKKVGGVVGGIVVGLGGIAINIVTGGKININKN